MKKIIPGGFSAKQFLQKYWQKKPLLIRQAFPGFGQLLTREKLIHLASQEDVQSRLVRFKKQKWALSYGPFDARQLDKLTGLWTLLVQDVNHFVPEAQDLLKNFNFIPHARLDDLMVSFASDGGGVGPHDDSYDVFLLQGTGKRIWQISKQKDRRLLPDAPLRVLSHFQSEEEWLLEPGDMLYLPPQYAHHGIAVGNSMTYSIGFRAPDYQTLFNEFLSYLQDHLVQEGIYSDPRLQLEKHPGRIPDDMLVKVSSALKKIRFGKSEIQQFLGTYLTEPKAHVFFTSPESPLNKKSFVKFAHNKNIYLDLKSQMLFVDEMLFMNGDSYTFKGLLRSLIKKLADEREIIFDKSIPEKTMTLLYEWYLNGFVHIQH